MFNIILCSFLPSNFGEVLATFCPLKTRAFSSFLPPASACPPPSWACQVRVNSKGSGTGPQQLQMQPPNASSEMWAGSLSCLRPQLPCRLKEVAGGDLGKPQRGAAGTGERPRSVTIGWCPFLLSFAVIGSCFWNLAPILNIAGMPSPYCSLCRAQAAFCSFLGAFQPKWPKPAAAAAWHHDLGSLSFHLSAPSIPFLCCTNH